jgi:uncharacterized protein (TIGR02246 family)
MAELRAEEAQILLLEMQPPIVAASQTVPGDGLKRSAATLKEVALAAGIPIMASVVPLSEQPLELVEELAGIEPLARSTVGVLDDLTISDRIAASGRRVLILGGVSSEIAMLHAVLGARRAGYDVHVLLDLCGGLDPRSEKAAFDRMWSAGAKASSVSSFATGLIDDMTTQVGRAIMQALDRYWHWGVHGGGEDAAASSSEQEIANLFDNMQAGWRDGDAERFAAVFADDSRFVAFDGAVLTGPKEIAAYHAPPFATYLAGTELRFGPLDVKTIADRVYVVASEGGIARGQQTEGGLIGRSAQTFVVERQEGGLRILTFQNTRVRLIDGSAAAEVWKRFDEDWAKLGR